MSSSLRVRTQSLDEDITEGTLTFPLLRKAIHPFAHRRVLWDLLMAVLIGYNGFSVPFRIAFSVFLSPSEWMYWGDRLVDFVFLYDVYINMYTGFTDSSGVVVLDLREIRRHYLTTWFTVDLVSSIPYELFIVDASTRESLLRTPTLTRGFKFLRVVKVIKMMRLLRLLSIMDRFESSLWVNYDLSEIVKFALFIVYVSHFLCCAFYMVGDLAVNTGRPNWVEEQGIVDEEIWVKYLTAFYFSLTTVTTIGYGDVVPVSPAGRLVTVVGMVIGAATFSYGITTVLHLVANLNRQKTDYKRRIGEAVQYMRLRNLPMELRAEIRGYLHYAYNTESERTARFISERDILETLSPPLRSKVILHVNEEVLGRVDFFESCNPEFLHLVVQALKPVYYAPDQIVVREGDAGSEMFIVAKGELEVVKYDTLRIATLGEGDYFGELAIFDESFMQTSANAAAGGADRAADSSVGGGGSQRPFQLHLVENGKRPAAAAVLPTPKPREPPSPTSPVSPTLPKWGPGGKGSPLALPQSAAAAPEACSSAGEWEARAAVRTATVRTTTFTDLRTLSYTGFASAVQAYPDAAEVIRDKVLARRRALLKSEEDIARRLPQLQRNFERQRRRMRRHSSSARRGGGSPFQRAARRLASDDSEAGADSEAECAAAKRRRGRRNSLLKPRTAEAATAAAAGSSGGSGGGDNGDNGGGGGGTSYDELGADDGASEASSSCRSSNPAGSRENSLHGAGDAGGFQWMQAMLRSNKGDPGKIAWLTGQAELEAADGRALAPHASLGASSSESPTPTQQHVIRVRARLPRSISARFRRSAHPRSKTPPPRLRRVARHAAAGARPPAPPAVAHAAAGDGGGRGEGAAGAGARSSGVWSDDYFLVSKHMTTALRRSAAKRGGAGEAVDAESRPAAAYDM